MKRILFFVSVLLLVIPSIDAQVTFQKTLGLQPLNYGIKSIVTADGGFLIAGTTGSSSFSLGNVMLVKTDANGSIQWSKNYVGNLTEIVANVLQNSDGSYTIVGSTFSFSAYPNGDVLMLKVDVNGNLLWTKHYWQMYSDFGTDIVATPDHGYAVCGYSNSSGRANDMYVLKLDSVGNVAWGESIGGAANDDAMALSISNDGNIVVTGSSNSYAAAINNVIVYEMFQVKLDMATGAILRAIAYGDNMGNCQAFCSTPTFDGGNIMAGRTDGYGANLSKVLVVKTDSLGIPQWSKCYGGAQDEFAYTIRQTANGGYVVGGSTESFGAGNTDMYFLRLDNLGNLIWSSCYGDTTFEELRGIELCSDGGFLLTGFQTADYNTASSIYVIKTDAAGSSGCFENDATTAPYANQMNHHTVAPTISGSWLPVAELYSTATGCNSNSLCSTVGVSESISSSVNVKLFPNPTTSDIHVTSEYPIDAIRVVDVLGQVVFQSQPEENEVLFSLQAEGVYFVTISSGKMTTTTKIIVSR